MSTKVYDIPPDIFKDIALFLEDEDLGALYCTGNTRAISLLRFSTTGLKYRRAMFADFPSIKTIENVCGDGNPLPPNLTSLTTFIPFDDDCMSVIPASVTKLGTSCENGVEFLNTIPKTVTDLTLTELRMDSWYTFPDNLKRIEIGKVMCCVKPMRIVLPNYIESVKIDYMESEVKLNMGMSDLLVHVDIPYCNINFDTPNLISLRCNYLDPTTKLPPLLETLTIRDFSHQDENILTQIQNLRNLRHLYLQPINADMVNYIPSIVERLEVEIVSKTECKVELHEGLKRLYLLCSPNIEVILPSTLTLLRCNQETTKYLSHLRNLEYLYVNDMGITTNGMFVEHYNFTIHPKLQVLYTNGCIDIQTLPDSICELSCHAVFSRGILPKRLQKITVARSCQRTIDNIKSKLKYCSISVASMVQSVQNISSIFEFFELSHLLEHNEMLVAAEEAAVLMQGNTPTADQLVNLLKMGLDIETVVKVIPKDIATPDVIRAIRDKIEQVKQQ